MRLRDASLSEALKGGNLPPPCSGVQAGTVAGNARRELEKKSGRKIVSRENYLDAPEATKRLSRTSAT